MQKKQQKIKWLWIPAGLVAYILLIPFIPVSAERFYLAVAAAALVGLFVKSGRMKKKDWLVLVVCAVVVLTGAVIFPFSVAKTIGGRVGAFEIAIAAVFTASVLMIFRAVWLVLFRAASRLGASEKNARILAGIVLFVAGFPYLFLIIQSHRVKVSNTHDPRTTYGLDFEDVAFTAADGTRLAGWFVPSGNSGNTVVLLHGVGANRANILPFTGLVHNAGWNVFTIDFRGHGESGGHTVTFGASERLDVAAAVKTVQEKYPKRSKRLVCYAFSMGAAAAVLAASDGCPLDGLILDSPFADAGSAVRHRMGRVMGEYIRIFLIPYALIESGVYLPSLAPANAEGAFLDGPVLIFSGTSDRVLSPNDSKVLISRFRGRKELVTTRGAGHIGSYSTSPTMYAEKVRSFLKSCEYD
jgi:fermentation-respiration switch protein FrsA (DUF1100 family)